MARLPTVAIIGRPNTGKSTLFNRIIGKRLAIVSETAGTTRDLVARKVEDPTLDYLLLDTGGIGGGSEDRDIEDDVAAQSLLALAHADLILFTVDAQEELTSSDYAAVDILRKKRRRHVPVLLVLTKCDQPGSADALLPSCYAFGIAEEIFPVSALHNNGIDKLRHAITDNLQKLHFTRMQNSAVRGPEALRPEWELRMKNAPRVAIIGKPNVGKSSLVNALMSPAERESSLRLVSDIPGTTRDASDTTICREERIYTLVDTAGIRRRANDAKGIEWYAHLRSIQSIADCDIALLLLDVLEGVARQDKRIARLALDEGKGLIILINKMDALPREEHEQALQRIAAEFAFCHFCPFLAVSAKKGAGLTELFSWIDTVMHNLHSRIPTRELHRWYESTVDGKPGRSSPIRHVTQANDTPPTFVLFTHNPNNVPAAEIRYLERRLRSTFALEGTPVRWVTKEG